LSDLVGLAGYYKDFGNDERRRVLNGILYIFPLSRWERVSSFFFPPFSSLSNQSV